jgi:hypothetical protein
MATRCAYITCECYILLKHKIFALFAMFLFTQFAVSEDDPYLSAITI